MELLKFRAFWFRFSLILIALLFAPLAISGNFDNLNFSGNTVSSRNSNGNIVFSPNGTGEVELNYCTANTVPYIDASKGLVSSSTTSTELGYLHGVTSAIQTQINNNQPMTTLGDIPYENSTPAPARLAGNITSTKKFLTQTGTGSISAAPGWNTIAGSDLPNPSASTLGGIESYASVSHQWINAISTSGVPASTQPACGDLSNAATSCSTDATNASNISSGTLAAGRLPTQLNLPIGFNQAAGTYGMYITCNSTSWDSCFQLTSASNNHHWQIYPETNGYLYFRGSDNGYVFVVDGSGNVALGGTGSPLANTTLISKAADQVQLTVKGNSTQTNHLQNWVTSTPTTLSYVAGDGSITAPTFTATTTAIGVGSGGTGQTSFTDGQLLIGNTTGNTLAAATLTAGSNITITNGHGSISIAASSSATPAFTMTSQSSTLNPAVVGTHYYLSGASFTITLPDATTAGNTGKPIIFEHAGTSLSQSYTFNTTSAQTINGPSGAVASGNYALYTQGEVLMIESDGANWRIIHHQTETPWTAVSGGLMQFYTLTCDAFTTGPTAGATYTNNANTYSVAKSASNSGTVVIMQAAISTTSGTTWTKATGTGDASLTNCARTGGGQLIVNTGTESIFYGSPVTNQYLWKRRGSSAWLNGFFYSTSAGPVQGSGDFRIGLPPNMQNIDTTYFPAYTGGSTQTELVQGTGVSGVMSTPVTGYLSCTGNYQYRMLQWAPYDSTHFRIYGSNAGAASIFALGAANCGGAGVDEAVSFSIEVPISGWQP